MTTWTLAGTVREQANQRGGRTALTTTTEHVSWSELDVRANRVANALRTAGVGAGDRVAFLDHNGVEHFEVLFGGAKVGAVNVAVNWRLTPDEIASIVDDARARVLVAGPDFAQVARRLAKELDHLEVAVVIGDDYHGWRDAAADDDPGGGADADDIVMQLYTSGTTGLPKGAMLSNRNLGALLDIVPHWNIDADAVSLVAMPLFHIGGVGWALVGMTVGARSVLVRHLDPVATLELMETEGVTNGFVVPAVLGMFAAVPGAGERDWSALRNLVYGASPISEDVLTRSIETFGCDMIQVYGLTETTGAITQLDAADHDPHGRRADLLRSAGKPFPWVEIAITDLETGQPLTAGEVGEVVTRSTQNLVGYFNRPEATREALTDDGWFRTGDAGRLDADGYLFLTDRVKDVIVSGGENVYPAEVENVLMSHPEVAEVAVIGVPDERFGEVVRAVVVADGALDPDGLIAWSRERMARFKAPRSVEIVQALPRTPTGKLLKRELRAPFWAGRDRLVG